MTTALKNATLELARLQRGTMAKPARKKPVHHESLEQRALIEWAAMQPIPPAPDVQPSAKVADYLFAIPNGGARSKVEAAIMKAEGVKAGVHDLQLPLARGIHLGLWIEMKFGDNKLSDHQLEWHARMVLAGWKCMACWSAVEAIEVIKAYLRTPRAPIHPPRPRILSSLDQVEPDKRATARPKQVIVRDQAYLRLVAARPCAHCGWVGASQAAHENDGKGKSLKTSDLRTFPLCHVGANDCHSKFDQYRLFYSRAEHIAAGKRWSMEAAQAIHTEGNWPAKHEFPY